MSTTEMEGAPPEPKALSSGSGFLWSPVSNGGDVMMVPTALGGERAVVTNRKIIAVGEKVTKKQLEASDEQWAEWVEGGVVRDYPFPDMPAGSSDSPIVFLQKKLNEAASSEEERLVAMVQGITQDDAGLAAAGSEADKDKK